MSADDSMVTVSDYYADSESYTRREITVADSAALSRTVTGTAVGNFTEWFDFGVYSYVIPIIAGVFFPQTGFAQILTFAGLAVSFAIRPIGGIFWGILGDRIGRKSILAVTVIMMAFGTFVVGVLPGYAAIGIGAPILLFVARGIQGFSTGGEYVGAMTFLAEHSPDRKRGHLCSFLPVGTLSGYILGAVIVIVLRELVPHHAMITWGWRIPFLVAGPLGLIGLYVRLHLEESPAYEKESKEESMSQVGRWEQLKTTVAGQWRPILICMGLVLSFNVTNYMLTGYMPTYLPEHLHIGENAGLITVVVIMAILAVIVTYLGRLSDRIGRKPVMYAGSILLVVVSVPMFLLLFHGSMPTLGLPVDPRDAAIFFGTLPQGLMLVCFMSTEPSTLPTLFPTNVRAGATGIAFNISVSAFGGTTPLIAAALVEGTGNLMMPAYILIIAGVVGIVSVAFMPEPVGTALKGSGPTVENEEQARYLADFFRRRRKRGRRRKLESE